MKLLLTLNNILADSRKKERVILVPEENDGSGSLVVKVRLKSYITHADVATDKERNLPMKPNRHTVDKDRGDDLE